MPPAPNTAPSQATEVHPWGLPFFSPRASLLPSSPPPLGLSSSVSVSLSAPSSSLFLLSSPLLFLPGSPPPASSLAPPSSLLPPPSALPPQCLFQACATGRWRRREGSSSPAGRCGSSPPPFIGRPHGFHHFSEKSISFSLPHDAAAGATSGCSRVCCSHLPALTLPRSHSSGDPGGYGPRAWVPARSC